MSGSLKLKVIKEGYFEEKEGAPTLRLVGDIEGIVHHDHVEYAETAYPYIQTSILEKIPINSYEFQALVWKFGVWGNPRYHIEIKTGKKSCVQKYSDKFLSMLREKLRKDKNLVEKTKKEYSAYRKKK